MVYINIQIFNLSSHFVNGNCTVQEYLVLNAVENLVMFMSMFIVNESKLFEFTQCASFLKFLVFCFMCYKPSVLPTNFS